MEDGRSTRVTSHQSVEGADAREGKGRPRSRSQASTTTHACRSSSPTVGSALVLSLRTTQQCAMLRSLLGSRSPSVLATRLVDASARGAPTLGTARGLIATPTRTHRDEPIPTSQRGPISRVTLPRTLPPAQTLHIPPTTYRWPSSAALTGARSLPVASALPNRLGHVRAFHSTFPTQAWPSIPLLLGFLKVYNSAVQRHESD